MRRGAVSATRRIACYAAGGFERFHREVIRGAAQYAAAHDHIDLVYEILPREFEAPFFATRLFDGVIVAAGGEEQRRLFVDQGLPLVSVGYPAGAERYPTVTADSEAAGRAIADHFLVRGFRRFASCGPDVPPAWSQRSAAFAARVREARPGAEVHDLVVGGHRRTPLAGAESERLAEWLCALPKPVALTTIDDLWGRRIVQLCRLLEIGVPEQLALVAAGGGEDDLVQGWSTIGLSVVPTYGDVLGREAMALLERIIDGEPPPREAILIAPPPVVTRQSSDVHAVEDPVVARALRFIIDHATRAIQVADVARACDTPRRTLERRFRGALGRSIAAEVRRVQLDRARLLLHDPDLAVGEIARRAGFRDVSYFSQAFRRATGLTPSHWRRYVAGVSEPTSS